MTQAEARLLFPHTTKGIIYVNHASQSPLSLRVQERMNDYFKKRSLTEIDDIGLLMKTMLEAKEKVGKLINAETERITFFDNTTNGINLLAQGLKWKKGDHIILNDLEFPANVYPFLNLKELGVEIDFVKSRDGKVEPEDIFAAIKPHTKVISISFVQFLTGYRADLELIGEVCKKNGIIFCVDAIQGMGALQLDVQKYNIDFLVFGSHKWMMAMMGVSSVYIKDALQEQLHPKYVGWLGVEDAWNLLDYNLTLKKTADAFQNGTINIAGLQALCAAIDLFNDFGTDNVESTILDNSEYFINILRENNFETILDGKNRNELSGIVSVKIDNSETQFEKLKENKVHCALREGIIRFAPHFYNTKDELEKIVEILKK